MPWQQQWDINANRRIVTSPRSGSQNEAIGSLLQFARNNNIFEVLNGWRDELYPIHGHNASEDTISMERAASPLFGINTYGVHMTVYVNTHEGMWVWVPRRAKDKQTYGGMLDNSVAGGLSTGEHPLDCIVREAAEEATLSEQMVRANAKACGTVSYWHISDPRAGGESGLLQPESQHIYDMEVGPEMIPKPGDNEVEAFHLLTIDEVKTALAEGQFKPNCALVLLDFFVRHGILTAENENDYVEIVSRLHRRLPFPTS